MSPGPTIHIDPARIIDTVDPRIYSGFTEHMGRCIYGGLYDPENEHGLADEKTGFRKDVLEVMRGLRVPVVRYPGGNFVSSYRWQDGIGPKDSRPRRPELAWLNEESNQFGTDEFIAWCRELGAEPYICLNMGTGTLEDALAWVEYCNSSANTYYANLRRKNGHEEPYNVKYWSLGNEVWGPWQIGQQSAADYAKTAYQWAKALRLLDPKIKLVACGETGYADWDRVVLRALGPVVDFHSIHIYTESRGKHEVNVMGPAAAEKAIQITRSLIDLAKIEGGLEKDLTICFDEWNVWDPIRAPGDKGAEEHYDLSDALAVAAWLNVFVRNADIVKVACIAQSVNVISPIVTSPEGLFRQTTFYPLQLFATLMQGDALDVYVSPFPSSSSSSNDKEEAGGVYLGPTVPTFVQALTKHAPASKKLTGWIDCSAVLSSPPPGAEGKKEIRLALLNRHPVNDFSVPLQFAGVEVGEEVKVHEVWSEELGDRNWFGDERVRSVERVERYKGGEGEGWRVKRHSFQVLVFTLVD